VKGFNALPLVAHLSRHPGEVPVVVGAAWRLRREGWWRRAPFLPVPGQTYWDFRLATATGSITGRASVREVVEFARWSDQQRTRG